jgi:hypothetical protein
VREKSSTGPFYNVEVPKLAKIAIDSGVLRCCQYRERIKGKTMTAIAWDQAATLIDLDGKAPMIGTIRECAVHFSIFTPSAQAQARILLTSPVAREGRRTRTWLLEPAEIEALVQNLIGER